MCDFDAYGYEQRKLKEAAMIPQISDTKYHPKKHVHKPYHTGSGEVVCSECGEPCSFAPSQEEKDKIIDEYLDEVGL